MPYLNHLEKLELEKEIQDSNVKMCMDIGETPMISCKICLESVFKENIFGHDMISPCRCSGSLKYVH